MAKSLGEALQTGTIVTLTAILLGIFAIDTPAYICDTLPVNDQIQEFDRLSGSQRTGYPLPETRIGGILCPDKQIWYSLDDYIEDKNLLIEELRDKPKAPIQSRVNRDQLYPDRDYCLKGGDIRLEYRVPISECL